MSLDIRIKENNCVVHNKNFYGFIDFNDYKNRFPKAQQTLKEYPVSDKKTFIEFIKQSVDYDRQNFYINLIKSDLSKVSVIIY